MDIREYTKKDIPDLIKLWVDVFSDKEEFVEAFYAMLPDMGSCVVGCEDGKIIAMASVIAGQELQKGTSQAENVVGYIYAVAVDKAFRGKGHGKEIVKAAYDLAIGREAEIVATMPSDDSLIPFYEETLGFETVLFRSKNEVEASDDEMTMKLTATEYNMMRESILSGKNFLRLSYFAMDFLKTLEQSCGGGLYASMSGICTAQKDGDTCIIHEMLSQNEKATAASVAYALDCSKAVYYLPSNKGENFIMAKKGKIPQDTLWNIAYE